MSKTGHNWSGWPGATCLNCHTDQKLETAVALNWVDVNPESAEPLKWKAEIYKKFVELCDDYCEAKEEPEKMLEIMKERYALALKLNMAQPCPNCGIFDIHFSICPDTGVEANCPHCHWTSLTAQDSEEEKPITK